jgi:hypothetical protein
MSEKKQYIVEMWDGDGTAGTQETVISAYSPEQAEDVASRYHDFEHFDAREKE